MVQTDAAHIRSSLRGPRVFVPGLIREVWDIFGEAAARRLVRHFGGHKIKVPSHIRPDGKLATALGHHVAKWLATRYAGDLHVPSAAHLRHAQCCQQAASLRGRGRSVSAIARELGATERTVHRWLRRADELLPAQKAGGRVTDAGRTSRGRAAPARQAKRLP